MPSIFDNAKTEYSRKIGNFYSDQKQTKLSTATVESNVPANEFRKQQAVQMKKAITSKAMYEEADRLKDLQGAMVGFTRPKAPTMEGRVFATPSEVKDYITESSKIFTEALTDKLFIEAVAKIAHEAAPVDPMYKSVDGIKEYMFNLTLEMYSDLKRHKDFTKVILEGNTVPTSVSILYGMCCECAELESAARFEFDTVIEAAGNRIESINEFVTNELANVNVSKDYLEPYEEMIAAFVAESEDIAEIITGKVKGEVENYKKTAEKMDKLKQAIIPPDATPPADPAAPADGGETPPADPATEPAAEPTADGETPPAEDPPADGGDKPADGGEEPPAEPAADGGDKSSEEPPAAEPDQTQENNAYALSNEESGMIEDAASFAEAKGHTFNSGSEKFDRLRDIYAKKMVDAAATNDINTLNRIRGVISNARDRLQGISEVNGNKYKYAIGKLNELIEGVTFELSKRVTKEIKAAHESMSILDNMILAIGKRNLNRITAEGSSISDINPAAIATEAIINYTVLETMNTLKLLDVSNEAERKDFQKFIDSIK